MPGRCSCSYSPEKGRSVAFSRSTAYCIGVSSRRHSASLFSTLPVVVLVSDIGFPPDFTVIASEANQSMPQHVEKWIASSQELLAMTGCVDLVGDLGAAH